MASDDEPSEELIGIFDADHPWPGSRITRDEVTWEVTHVVLVSGQWAAWGRPVDDP